MRKVILRVRHYSRGILVAVSCGCSARASSHQASLSSAMSQTRWSEQMSRLIDFKEGFHVISRLPNQH
jgi:hypothetical protein